MHFKSTKDSPSHLSLATLAQFLVQYKNMYQPAQYHQLILLLPLQDPDPAPVAPASRTSLKDTGEETLFQVFRTSYLHFSSLHFI